MVPFFVCGGKHMNEKLYGIDLKKIVFSDWRFTIFLNDAMQDGSFSEYIKGLQDDPFLFDYIGNLSEGENIKKDCFKKIPEVIIRDDFIAVFDKDMLKFELGAIQSIINFALAYAMWSTYSATRCDKFGKTLIDEYVFYQYVLKELDVDNFHFRNF